MSQFPGYVLSMRCGVYRIEYDCPHIVERAGMSANRHSRFRSEDRWHIFMLMGAPEGHGCFQWGRHALKLYHRVRGSAEINSYSPAGENPA